MSTRLTEHRIVARRSTAILTPKLLDDLDAKARAATPGPWCWTYISGKNNGYIVGTAADGDDRPLSGQLPEDEMLGDELLECWHPTHLLGEHEAATVNYGDAVYIAAVSPEVILALVSAARERDRLRADRDAVLEEAARICETKIAEPFGRLAQAMGVGKAEHAQGGDLSALKAITAEECAASIRGLKGDQLERR